MEVGIGVSGGEDTRLGISVGAGLGANVGNGLEVARLFCGVGVGVGARVAVGDMVLDG